MIVGLLIGAVLNLSGCSWWISLIGIFVGYIIHVNETEAKIKEEIKDYNRRNPCECSCSNCD